MSIKTFFIAILFFSFTSQSQDLIEFKKDNKLVKSFSIAELKKLTQEEALQVWEPHENKNIDYMGFSTVAVMNKVFGKDWKKYDLILFICADGYKDPIPTTLFDSEKSLLAFAKKDKSSFSVSNRFQNEKNIPLAPLYLIWNNLNNEQIRAEEANNWPYQVIGIELAQFADKFPHMIPPRGSSENILNGFHAFQKYCMTCHKVNSDGGDKGPELTRLVPTLEKNWLTKWISNPQSVDPKTKMPAVRQNLKDREQVIANIISYLDSQTKVKP